MNNTITNYFKSSTEKENRAQNENNDINRVPVTRQNERKRKLKARVRETAQNISSKRAKSTPTNVPANCCESKVSN